MNKSIRFLQKGVFLGLFLITASGSWRAVMATDYSSFDFSSTPPTLSQNVAPMVLFGLSNDHQLFYKAYTDYDDLDSDGTIDTTYLHSFSYYGYFDSEKCYDYVGDQFEPQSLTDDDNYCTGTSSSYWSGNYLNWATMARIDTVRKLLYGGTRSIDSATETVLERAYLPNDAHSFAKYYDGTDLKDLTPFSGNDIKDGITICNTTVSSTTYSQNVTDAPLIRVAKGDFSLWAANERWQCRWSGEKGASNANDSTYSGINAASSNPQESTYGLGQKDYNARIQVCDSTLIGTENCKQYPDGNYKPIGLVQKYGDDEIVNFGLMTGSYTLNKSGGVLRKNVGGTSDEINATTNGTFKAAPADGSIIDTLDSFRLYGYNHSSGTYNDTYPGDNCKWAKSSFVNGDCSNWGNPVAEILSECYRYYGGKNAAFNTDDSGKISGLTTATWSDPLNTVNECAKLNVIMINASSISYDSDELGVFDKAFGADVEDATNDIGNDEGIKGNQFFVGENGTDNDQLCSAKTVTNLADVEGICPDAPRLEGSYKMAGAAHYAYTNDLRTSLDGEQTVTTYGVALSPAIPSLTIPVPGSSTDEINILPACRNTGNNTNCAIVDFKISEEYQEDSSNPGEYVGTLYVNWEDSEQGGDYDQDMWGTIKYRITSSKITITTDVIAESTGEKLGFGYVISGTTDDGFHVHSGISGATIDSCSNCQESNAATSQEYTLGSSTADFLYSPLYYAAKWGGFTDLDDDGTPSSVAEWDTTDNLTGDSVADGIPDKYFLATNPSQLETQLKQVLDSIIASTSAGTSAAVVSNSTSGAGAIYQALYQPQLTLSNDTIEWVGHLNGIFIDGKANLREDANSDGILDDYDTDKIIKISYDDALGDTFFQRYTTTDNGTTLVTDGGLESLDDLLPIWSAAEELASVSDVITQRGYTAKANTGRYIFTAVKDTGSSTSMVNNHDIVDFTASNMEPYYGYMATEQSEVPDLINYIRGDDSVSNSRSRTINGSVWRLGDIIHSSPILVSSPDAGYDDSHGDTDYGEFVTQYSDRRHMVYVGANDGMLHAFNAGFWKESATQFDTTTTDISSVTEHNLGAEVWAYVPTNLLPHLQWLKQASYPHVYYMDGVGFAQDVKIFDDDAIHPNGWGTILVMGMRFGGGAMDLDIDDDGTVDQTTGSGYVIMDITDPESAPILLAEITAPEFGYTTSKPVIVQDRSGNNNKWTLVIGSGPHGDSALTTGQSDQAAKIIQVDLRRVFINYNKNQNKNIYRDEFSPSDTSTSEGTSLVGDLTVADWDEDLEDDVVYFGTSSLAGTSVEGKLMRLSLSSGTNGDVNTLVNVQKPIIGAPLIGIDTTIDTNRWIMAGTGRFVTSEDTLNEDQQWYFGVKEVKETDDSYAYSTEVGFGNLEDTTDIIVYSDGSLLKADDTGNTNEYSLGGDTIDNFDEMKNGTNTKPTAGMIGHSGWKISFEKPTGAPSGRFTGAAVASNVSSGLIVFAEYVPPSEVCEIYGDSYIWALSFETGTSTYYAPLGQDSYNTVVNDEGVTVTASSSKISAGDLNGDGTGATGLVTGISTFTDSEGNELIIVSDGAGGQTTKVLGTEVITGSSGRQSWRQIDTSAF